MRINRLLLSTVLSVLLCFSLFTSVKAETMMWSKTFQEIMGYSVIEATDGGYALAGTTGNNCWLVKTDAAGNVEWNQTYGGGGFRSLVATSDNGYALAGTTNPYGFDAGEIWLVKTDSLGNIEWNKTYGESGYIEGRSLVATSDGGYAFAAFTDSLGAGGLDIWLVKTDTDGNMEWNKTYGGIENDAAFSLVETSDGGYAMAGAHGSTHLANYDIFGHFLGGDCWAAKTDSLGNMEWNKTYVESGYIEVRSLIEASDGGYAIAGTTAYSFGSDAEGYNFGLIKTDSLGNMEWNRTYGGTGADYGHFLVETSDGGYAIAGTRDCSFILIPRGTSWLVKTDSLGNMEWNKTYAEENAHWTCSLIAASDGGYAMASYAYLENNPGFVLIKTDEFGVVPEAAWVILPLLLIATFSVFISKKKLRQF